MQVRRQARVRTLLTVGVIGCLVLIALDSGRVPMLDLGPAYWLVAALYVAALVSRRVAAYRVASAGLIALSLLRATLYLFDDGRIAPIGLNGLIALGITAAYLGRDRSLDR